jgi:hypothetical protein
MIPPPPPYLRKHFLTFEPDPQVGEPLRSVIIAARAYLEHTKRRFPSRTALVATVNDGKFTIDTWRASDLVQNVRDLALRRQLAETADSLAGEQILLFVFVNDDYWFGIVVLPPLNSPGGAG